MSKGKSGNKKETKAGQEGAESDKKPQPGSLPEIRTLQELMAELTPLQMAILQEVRRKPALSYVKLGELLEVDRDRVSKAMNDPKFKRVLAEATASTLALLDRYAPDAARVLGQQVNDRGDKRIAQGAAKAILDLTIGTLNRVQGAQAGKPPLPEGIPEEDGGELIRKFRDGLKKKPE